LVKINQWGDLIGEADGAHRDGAVEAPYVTAGHMDVPDWKSRYIGKGIWELRPLGTYPGKLAQTGADMSVDARVPANHRLVRFEWKHLTSLLVDGTDATEALLLRDDYEPLGAILWRLYFEAASISSTTIVPFGEGYEYMACTYRLTFHTTQGDWIVPILYVQELKP
jgi:hypothetical protein